MMRIKTFNLTHSTTKNPLNTEANPNETTFAVHQRAMDSISAREANAKHGAYRED